MAEASFQAIRDQADLAGLRQAVHQLQGLPCWRAFESIGGQCVLYLGAKVPARNKKLDYVGEWVVHILASDWRIDRLTFPSKSTAEIIPEGRRIEALEGTNVLLARVYLCTLQMQFSNGCTLWTEPMEEDELSEVPHWQLLGPEKRCWVVGPGFRWSMVSSDQAY